LIELRPWPVVPQPFPEEAFGGWLGRVAARYRMAIGALWGTLDVGPLPALRFSGWLLFPPQEDEVLLRLSMIARLERRRLLELQTPRAWITKQQALHYCFRCLMINDQDVFHPRWKREWLDPDSTVCAFCGTDLEQADATLLSRSRHFNEVLYRLATCRWGRPPPLYDSYRV
jgi:hypothetical protein